MCLYPKLIYNKKYTANKKNGGNIPEPKDKRVLMVPIGCGKCMECRKQKGRAWSIRLQEEIKTCKANQKQFVTLTFSNESIKELSKEIELEGYERDNQIAILGVRRFLERWRKKYTISLKHWLVTELGHNGTENIHLHGILFTEQKEDIKKIWNYGWVYVGDYVNERTINYCVKYSTKADPVHKEYNPRILTSPGIGKNYKNTLNAKLNRFRGTETDETYRSRQGQKMNLPIYYRNTIYTEEQREKLWLQKLDEQTRWVDGSKISVADGTHEYIKTLKEARKKNERLGYGNDKKNWKQIKYENDMRNVNFKKRTEEKEAEIIEETYGFKKYKKLPKL